MRRRWGSTRGGAGQGCDPLIYITIGTGIGGGGAGETGNLLHGMLHPEMGAFAGDASSIVRAVSGLPHGPFSFELAWRATCAGRRLRKRWGCAGGDVFRRSMRCGGEFAIHASRRGLVNMIVTACHPRRIIFGRGRDASGAFVPDGESGGAAVVERLFADARADGGAGPVSLCRRDWVTRRGSWARLRRWGCGRLG